MTKIFPRYILAINYLEYFMVSAVSSILLIRLFLELTGYPQIGGDTLHIAHMLWGGLLMLISIIFLLSFIGRTTEYISAFIGGIGFGTFIDEIGKFITQDNDYFYQPSVAIMYVIFILIFLAIKTIHRKSGYSSQEYLLNAVRELQEIILKKNDNNNNQRILEYLNKSGHRSAISENIKELILATGQDASPAMGKYQKIKLFLRSFYQKVAISPAFNYFIILLFLFRFITQFLYIILLIFFWGMGWEKLLSMQLFQDLSETLTHLSFTEAAELLALSFSGILTFWGIFYLPKSRQKAYRMFERSILVSIFFTQVFVFYREEFGALVGLMVNLLVFLGLQFMMRRETSSQLNLNQDFPQ